VLAEVKTEETLFFYTKWETVFPSVTGGCAYIFIKNRKSFSHIQRGALNEKEIFNWFIAFIKHNDVW
jgi:hypothetical protein